MKIIASVSGGLDSAVMLYSLLNQGNDVFALSISYGQRHAKELGYAARTCRKLGVPWRLVDLSCLKSVLGGSSQTDMNLPVPQGHYTAENMELTVVPNRNMILLSVAAGYAISQGAEGVAYAAHAGDHTIYPDCRPEFTDAMAKSLRLCHFEPVKLLCPFMSATKADIVSLGARLDVPFEDTWSCYEGLEKHCGLCGTCVERKEAFELAGVSDPTEYERHST